MSMLPKTFPMFSALFPPDPLLSPLLSPLPQVELLQVGTKGDLIVGTTELRVLSLVNKPTVIHWLDLKAFNQSVGAQLCCVMRYLSGEEGERAERPRCPCTGIP